MGVINESLITPFCVLTLKDSKKRVESHVFQIWKTWMWVRVQEQWWRNIARLRAFNVRRIVGRTLKKPLEKSRGFSFSLHGAPLGAPFYLCYKPFLSRGTWGQKTERPQNFKKVERTPWQVWQMWFMLHASQRSDTPFSWALPRVITHLGKATPTNL